MHAAKLLHKIMENTHGAIDKRVLRTLVAAAETLTLCKHISILGLDRALGSKAMVNYGVNRTKGLPTGNSGLV